MIHWVYWDVLVISIMLDYHLFKYYSLAALFAYVQTKAYITTCKHHNKRW